MNDLMNTTAASTIAGIFNNSAWAQYASNLTKDIGAYPNGIYFNQDENLGALVAHRGQHDTWSVNANGFQYVLAAAREGKIAGGFVVLAAGKPPEVIAFRNIEEVASMLDGVLPRDGSFGPYWWLDAQFTTTSRPRVIEKR